MVVGVEDRLERRGFRLGRQHDLKRFRTVPQSSASTTSTHSPWGPHMWPRTFLMVMSIPAPSVQSSDVEDSLFPQLRQRPVLLAPAGGAHLGPKLEAFVAAGAHDEIPPRHTD